MKKIELLNDILFKWYNDGFATWTSRGSNDGVDGIFGGSFHDMGELKELNEGEFEVWLDFGSADKSKAMDELNNRLNVLGFKAEESARNETIRITDMNASKRALVDRGSDELNAWLAEWIEEQVDCFYDDEAEKVAEYNEWVCMFNAKDDCELLVYFLKNGEIVTRDNKRAIEFLTGQDSYRAVYWHKFDTFDEVVQDYIDECEGLYYDNLDLYYDNLDEAVEFFKENLDSVEVFGYLEFPR